ncbi:ribonuclease III [Magnetococcales bacterium HHB-1]
MSSANPLAVDDKTTLKSEQSVLSSADHLLDQDSEPLEEEVCWFEKTFGYRFKEPELLRHALTHRSMLTTLSQKKQVSSVLFHNERLEFLGDAVLNLVVTHMLFHRFASSAEGDLSRWRADLVNTRALGALGRSLGVGDYVRLGRGELLNGGRIKYSIIGNCVEALLGAVYLDSGLIEVEKIIHHLFSKRLERSEPVKKDFKTLLQEQQQGNGYAPPTYQVIHVAGAPHEREFHVQCMVTQGLSGQGKGRSKRQAEQAAAEQVYQQLVPASLQ